MMGMRKILTLGLTLAAGLSPLVQATEEQREQHNTSTSPLVYRYKLLDIGETKLDRSQLSALTNKFNYAPAINNNSQGTANCLGGGQVFLPTGWKYLPQISGMQINFHAINQNGDLLVSLARGQDSIEWMIWPLKDRCYGSVKLHVHTLDPFNMEIFFSAFSDTGKIIGYQRSAGKNIPIQWTAQSGIQKLGAHQGLEIHGIAKSINKSGSIVGIAETATDNYPFFWSESSGIEFFKSYRNFLVPKGWVEFADMVIASDDTVYGTFWIRDRSEAHREAHPSHYAYAWKPQSSNTEMLDLKGMRIAAVNGSHTLVGSLGGAAAMCKLGSSPICLKDAISKDQLEGWELLEATGINHQGDIVGYGKFNGAMHIFLAHKDNSSAPHNQEQSYDEQAAQSPRNIATDLLGRQR